MKYVVIILVVLIVIHFLMMKKASSENTKEAVKPCVKTVIAPGGQPFEIPCNMVYEPVVQPNPTLTEVPLTNVIITKQLQELPVLNGLGVSPKVSSPYQSL